jgi:hypothetical protein
MMKKILCPKTKAPEWCNSRKKTDDDKQWRCTKCGELHNG